MKKQQILFVIIPVLAALFAFTQSTFAQGNSTSTTRGNATSSAMTTKDKGNASSSGTTTKANGNATSSAAKNRNNATTSSISEIHRSEVATFVQSLVSRSDRLLGGIGEQVREIAREQASSSEAVAEAISNVEKRGGFTKFLIGSDYKNIGVIRSEIAQTDKRLERLETELVKAGDTVDTTVLETEIQTLKDSQVKLEQFIKDNEGGFSLLGWFVRLF